MNGDDHEDLKGGRGITMADLRRHIEQIPGAVLVIVVEDYHSYQVWVHVRGGDRADAMLRVREVEDLSSAAVRIQLDNAGSLTRIAIVAATEEVWNWTLGSVINDLAPGTNYRIRIFSEDDTSLKDRSNGTFEIVAAK